MGATLLRYVMRHITLHYVNVVISSFVLLGESCWAEFLVGFLVVDICQSCGGSHFVVLRIHKVHMDTEKAVLLGEGTSLRVSPLLSLLLTGACVGEISRRLLCCNLPVKWEERLRTTIVLMASMAVALQCGTTVSSLHPNLKPV